jgi:glycosyltransferase involved in cell wall biosynthesis
VIASFLKTHPKAWAFIGGGGPALDDVKAFFKTKPGGDRVVCPGTLKGEDLLNAYHAMNVFAFASHSETQGLVLAEAMAAGKPVVAVDAPGVRDILQDGYNGYMLDRDLVRSFVKVLGDMAVKPEKEYAVLSQNARKTVQDYDIRKTSDMILALYGAVIAREYVNREEADSLWQRTKEKLRTEFEILKNMGGAAGKAIGHMMQAS